MDLNEKLLVIDLDDEQMKKTIELVQNTPPEAWLHLAEYFRRMPLDDERPKTPPRFRKNREEYIRDHSVQIYIQYNCEITGNKKDKIDFKDMYNRYLKYYSGESHGVKFIDLKATMKELIKEFESELKMNDGTLYGIKYAKKE